MGWYKPQGWSAGARGSRAGSRSRHPGRPAVAPGREAIVAHPLYVSLVILYRKYTGGVTMA
jgi:hypothetical protein